MPLKRGKYRSLSSFLSLVFCSLGVWSFLSLVFRATTQGKHLKSKRRSPRPRAAPKSASSRAPHLNQQAAFAADALGITLAWTWNHPGIMLASTWNHPGIMLASTWDHPGIILEYTLDQLISTNWDRQLMLANLSQPPNLGVEPKWLRIVHMIRMVRMKRYEALWYILFFSW